MNLSKINPWVAGTALIIAGTILFYLEDYRNNQVISVITGLMIFGGWMVLFIKATKGTSIGAKKIAFSEDRSGWFKQRGSNLFYYLILLAVIGFNVFVAIGLSQNRKLRILRDEPTNTATAVIEGIDVRHSRSSTYYYAIFAYTANGKFTTHYWSERHESDFIVGDKYTIRYSVKYPEMIEIIEKIP